MEFKDVLMVDNERDLFLVTQKVKPAATIAISPAYNKDAACFVANAQGIVYWVSGEVRREFEAKLSDQGIVYLRRDVSMFFPPDENPIPMLVREARYFVARDPLALLRLQTAKTNEAEGLALGYPPTSAAVYGSEIDGKRRNMKYFNDAVRDAKSAGVALPSWLPFIPFIPSALDIVNGEISRSSAELGKEYEQAVRTNPDLAARLEADFAKRFA